MKARKLMTPSPLVATGDELVSHVAQRMRDADIGFMPVVDDRAHMHLRGVITDRDIVVRFVAERHGPGCTVEDHLTQSHLVVVSPDARAEEVMTAMESEQVRRLAVVENGRLVGVIAQADLALREGPRRPLRVEAVLERISEGHA